MLQNFRYFFFNSPMAITFTSGNLLEKYEKLLFLRIYLSVNDCFRLVMKKVLTSFYSYSDDSHEYDELNER